MEKNYDYYELTLSQQIMYYALKYSPRKNIVNIGTSMWFNDDIDSEILEKAIVKSIERMDAMRIRLTKVENVIKQYVSDKIENPVNKYDFSYMSEEEIEIIFDKWTKKAAKWKDVPLYQINLVKAPNNKLALYIRVNHVIMDAWALTIFASDLIEVYAAIKENKMLPAEINSFIPILEEEIKYAHSEQKDKDFQFWKNEINKKPKYAAINPKNVGREYSKGSLRFKSKPKIFTLQKEKVEVINSYCKKERISPQILFLLGLQCYLALLNQHDEVLINNVLSRRSKMSEKRAGGMMINPLLLLIKCPKNVTFEEACNLIMDKQFAAFRHGGFPFQELTDYIWKKYGTKDLIPGMFTDISFTYQLGKINLDGFDYSIKYHSNGSSGIALYLTVMDAGDTGNLDFIFEYTLSKVNEEIIDKIYYQMIKAIELGIESPNNTLEHIMNMLNS